MEIHRRLVQSLSGEAATVFLRDAVTQLRADGRPDLAREAQRLSACELHAVLLLALAGCVETNESKLLLGTSRSTRLKEFRAISVARKR
ncbi:hypothetical protein CA603_18205 [Paraburkholderia hospita]|nr:hypothetical protein CA603_18205 [Paraburkholderia hospita]